MFNITLLSRTFSLNILYFVVRKNFTLVNKNTIKYKNNCSDISNNVSLIE